MNQAKQPYSVDIIIPTQLKNPLLLSLCLNSLEELQLETDEQADIAPEVLIVANTTQSAVDEFLEQHKNEAKLWRLPIRWKVMGSNTGFTGAVNAGVALGHAPVIVLLNDDTQVTPNWLRELVSTQIKTKAEMVASRVVTSKSMGQSKENQVVDSLGFSFLWRGKAEAIKEHGAPTYFATQNDYWKNTPDLFKDINEPFGPDGAAALYTRDLWQKLGGMDDTFFAYLEDVEFALRARLGGARCTLATDAIVYHTKHATSQKVGHFKVKQDLVNWCRITFTKYPLRIWLSFGLQIMLERLRNLSGLIKSYLNV